VDEFDIDVLGSIGNDYEAIHTIRGDLERDLGRSVASEEVGVSLCRLVELGFADAFQFDAATGMYRQVSVAGRDVADLWFMMNARGTVEYERSAA
jgi:hypothetical protein